jgi:hypothetical protein
MILNYIFNHLHSCPRFISRNPTALLPTKKGIADRRGGREGRASYRTVSYLVGNQNLALYVSCPGLHSTTVQYSTVPYYCTMEFSYTRGGGIAWHGNTGMCCAIATQTNQASHLFFLFPLSRTGLSDSLTSHHITSHGCHITELSEQWVGTKGMRGYVVCRLEEGMVTLPYSVNRKEEITG